MGIYDKRVYKRNKKGQWKCQSCSTENVSHKLAFWKKSKAAENKPDMLDRTYLTLRNSRSGKEKFVSSATTYFGRDEKVVRKLITTSNKIPKKKRW